MGCSFQNTANLSLPTLDIEPKFYCANLLLFKNAEGQRSCTNCGGDMRFTLKTIFEKVPEILIVNIEWDVDDPTPITLIDCLNLPDISTGNKSEEYYRYKFYGGVFGSLKGRPSEHFVAITEKTEGQYYMINDNRLVQIGKFVNILNYPKLLFYRRMKIQEIMKYYISLKYP